METERFMLLSGALSFGAPLALAVCELVMLRRGRPDRGGGGSWRRAPRPDTPPPPRPAPAGTKPLPECLVPTLPPPRRPAAARPRVLEDA